MNQSPNSIILNASGTILNTSTTGLFIKPVRNIVSSSNYITTYNPAKGEISYDSTVLIPFYQVASKDVVFHTSANNSLVQTLSVKFERVGNFVTMSIPEISVNIGNSSYQYITGVGVDSTDFYPDFAVPIALSNVTHSVNSKDVYKHGSKWNV